MKKLITLLTILIPLITYGQKQPGGVTFTPSQWNVPAGDSTKLIQFNNNIKGDWPFLITRGYFNKMALQWTDTLSKIATKHDLTHLTGLPYWPLSGSASFTNNVVINANTRTFSLVNSNGGVIGLTSSASALQFNDGSNTGIVSAKGNGSILSIKRNSDSFTSSLAVTPTDMTVVDQINNKGLVNDSLTIDTSKYTDWSLVNKKWVQDRLTTAGTGVYWPLGGNATLTNDVSINGSGKIFSLADINSYTNLYVNMVDTTQSYIDAQSTGGDYTGHLATFKGSVAISKQKFTVGSPKFQQIIFGGGISGLRQDGMWVQDFINNKGLEYDNSVTNSKFTKQSLITKGYADSTAKAKADSVKGTNTFQSVATAGNTYTGTINTAGYTAGTKSRQITATFKGSSITKGVGQNGVVDYDSTFVNKGSRIMGIRTNNNGLSGRAVQCCVNTPDSSFYTTRTSIPKYVSGDYLILECQVNDAIDSAHYSVGVYKIQIDSVVMAAINNGGFPANHIILANYAYYNPPTSSAYPNVEHRHDEYSNLMQQEATLRGTLFYDDYYAFKTKYTANPSLLDANVLHPTPAGYTVAANDFATWFSTYVTPINLANYPTNLVGSTSLYGDVSISQNANINGDINVGNKVTASAISINGLPTLMNDAGTAFTPQGGQQIGSAGNVGYGLYNMDGLNNRRSGIFISSTATGFTQLYSTSALPFWVGAAGVKWFGADATGLTISTIPTLGTAATTYLTSNSGKVSSRTVAQVLADIGAAPSASPILSGTTTVTTLNATTVNSTTVKTGGATLTNVTDLSASTYTPGIGSTNTTGTAGIEAYVADGTNNIRAALTVNNTVPRWGLGVSSSIAAPPFVIRGNSTDWLTITGGVVNISNLTASLPVKTDASKNLISGAINLASTTDVTGFQINNITAKTANYTVVAGDFVAGKKSVLDIPVDATSGNVTITLPSASTFAGYEVNVIKTDATANTVTVVTSLGNNVFTKQYQGALCVSNSAAWYARGYNPANTSGQIALTAGVATISIPSVSTSSKALVTLVSIGGTVSTTWQYKAVCTAGTLTITAITNTGTTDTTDTSTLNYFVTQ